MLNLYPRHTNLYNSHNHLTLKFCPFLSKYVASIVSLFVVNPSITLPPPTYFVSLSCVGGDGNLKTCKGRPYKAAWICASATQQCGREGGGWGGWGGVGGTMRWRQKPNLRRANTYWGGLGDFQCGVRGVGVESEHFKVPVKGLRLFICNIYFVTISPLVTLKGKTTFTTKRFYNEIYD